MAISKNREKDVFVIIVGVILIVVASFVSVILPKVVDAKTRVVVGSGVFSARVIEKSQELSDDYQQIQGLSGNEAVLLDFNHVDKWSLDSTNVANPVDVLWLNDSKIVVYLEQSVSANHSKSKTFKPVNAIKYILVLPDSSIAQSSITVNSLATFQVEGEE